MSKFTKADKKKIKELREKFPERISVKASRSKDGGFVAEITTFPGCFTQAETLSELIDMVNNCIRTYLEIPSQLCSFMPTYLPPVNIIYNLDLFPAPKKEVRLEMRLPHYEGTRNQSR